jgi:hypothetical protein
LILAVGAACCLIKYSFAEGSTESSGRIDISRENINLDFANVKTNGYIESFVNKKDAAKNWMAQMELEPNQWQELWIEFTPSVSGFVIVQVRGSNYPDLKVNRHQVWADDVRVEGLGALIKNGSFENRDLLGNLVGWHWAQPSMAQYNTDAKLAHKGKSAVLVWHDNPLIARTPVKGGERYKVSAWFRPYAN